MKQQVTAAMMTMPTNRAAETPMTRGMRRRSAAGERMLGKDGFKPGRQEWFCKNSAIKTQLNLNPPSPFQAPHYDSALALHDL